MSTVEEFTKFVQENSVNLNRVDEQGKTVLDRAIELKNFELVQKIIAAGAKISNAQQADIDAFKMQYVKNGIDGK